MNDENKLLAQALAWCEAEESKPRHELLAAIAVIVGLVALFGVLHLSV